MFRFKKNYCPYLDTEASHRTYCWEKLFQGWIFSYGCHLLYIALYLPSCQNTEHEIHALYKTKYSRPELTIPEVLCDMFHNCITEHFRLLFSHQQEHWWLRILRNPLVELPLRLVRTCNMDKWCTHNVTILFLSASSPTLLGTLQKTDWKNIFCFWQSDWQTVEEMVGMAGVAQHRLKWSETQMRMVENKGVYVTLHSYIQLCITQTCLPCGRVFAFSLIKNTFCSV